MTLLKHEPSAQIPWQNTMLGFAELLTVETSSAFAAVKLPKNEAPANAALADRNVERLTLLRVLIMVQVCAAPEAVHNPQRYLWRDLSELSVFREISIPYGGVRTALDRSESGGVA